MDNLTMLKSQLPEDTGVIVLDQVLRRYVVSFNSSAGMVLVLKNRAYFMTDFRYIEKARAQIKNADVVEITAKDSYEECINRILQQNGIKDLWFDGSKMTYENYVRYKRALDCNLSPNRAVVDNLRRNKKAFEIDNIRQAQEIAHTAYERLLKFITVGKTEKEIAACLTYLMLREGAENMSFDPIVVSGLNSSMPHGVPSDKAVGVGEFVTMDFGCVYNGYCSDMTRTICIGSASDEMANIYDLVLQAQQCAIGRVKAGVKACEVDKAAREVISNAGFCENFGHGVGHGIGVEIHEAPSVSENSRDILFENDVISVEPGIYLPGQFGVRIEDMLRVTYEGCENLTRTHKKLVII